MRFCALDTIHHAAYNLKASCQMHFIARSHIRSEVHLWFHSIAHSQPAWLYALNCSRWHTPSLLDCTLSSKLSRRSQAHSRACSQVHSQLHLMTHSQPAWLYAPKSALKALPRTPPSTHPSTPPSRSQAHSRAHSQVHSQLHLMTLPTCLTVSSQVISQDTPKNTSQYTPKYTSELREWPRSVVVWSCHHYAHCYGFESRRHSSTRADSLCQVDVAPRVPCVKLTTGWAYK